MVLHFSLPKFLKKILFILIYSTTPFLLSPCDLPLIHTAPVPTISLKTKQWPPNKPNGLYSAWLLDMSLVKIPFLTFFLLLFLISLHWHFLSVFLQVSGPIKWEPKKYLWASTFAKHCSLEQFIILISIWKSLWSLTVNLHNCGESKVPKLFRLQNPFH